MAFSTQKEFFHVPFMNESVEYECQEVCVKLKSYPSTFDDRAWAADDEKKSRFVSDLVSCNAPLTAGRPGDGAGAGAGRGGRGGRGPEGRTLGAKGKRPGQGQGQGKGKGQGGPDDNLMMGDSLIHAADETLGRVKELMVKNNLLQKQLDDSKDRLVTAKEENAEIKRIMNQRYDPEKSKALKKKIKELEDAKKIDPRDAQELNALQQSIDDMNKAHDILEAENSQLKRLVEKQSKRVPMESIKIDPEKSNDVNYLQNKIDNLGKELALLRQAEDECMRQAQAAGAELGQQLGDSDVDNIAKILAERDSLRRKLKSLAALEDKVNKLQQKADQADYTSGDLAQNLNEQNRYINDMENEMQDMQKYYENEVEQTKYNEQVLKCRCKELKDQVVTLQPAVQRVECQQLEIDVLRNELRKRDIALNAYDCQYQQLMYKTKSFKKSGYRYLDEIVESGSESCGEPEEDGNCTC
ncbi:keratin, type II cytoskeletal 5 isoform X2 [Drosophila busckii]|uniref:keratin, type II cytoskeletal 5 isoform X2 n=1 Tax=Drosophila busckii TaxID=30019 RepID=UPI00083EDF2A|nr:keratin, type II cytoskeletal 5 isoform X2 [Drosophila busckii]